MTHPYGISLAIYLIAAAAILVFLYIIVQWSNEKFRGDDVYVNYSKISGYPIWRYQYWPLYQNGMTDLWTNGILANSGLFAALDRDYGGASFV